MKNYLLHPVSYLLLLVALLSPLPAAAALRLAGLFTDHAVLQRNAIVPVWGFADPGQTVTVSFAGQTKSATADTTGRWTAQLDPMPASSQPRPLTVTAGTTTLTLNDILVGEVWLAAGQSNMRSPLFAAHNAAEVLPTATDDQFRFFLVTLRTAAEPQADLTGSWKPTTPQAARDFYAVAYFFARELRTKLDVPVGVVGVAWGGTPIKTWISLQGLQATPPQEKALAEWQTALDQYAKIQADPSLVATYQADLARWQKEVEAPFKTQLKAWEQAKAAGQPVGEKPKLPSPEPSNPDPMGMPSPSRRPGTPTVSFNGVVHPVAPYAFRGILWYQGEADGSRGIEYRSLFPRLIQDWRRHFGAELPFLYVQIPAVGLDKEPVASAGMPFTREAQFMALSQPRTSMATIIDIGDPNDAHPANKVDVGQRLALLARRDVYGEPNLIASGPLYKSFTVEGSAIRIHFTHTGTGLTPAQAPWRAPAVEPLPTDHLVGFFIAGEDRVWSPATATIDGHTVLVSSPAVPHPVAVRYGWANSPRCNLYNRELLPAAPFRTDSWDTPLKK
jgi:sialate O-acetylesterase